MEAANNVVLTKQSSGIMLFCCVFLDCNKLFFLLVCPPMQVPSKRNDNKARGRQLKDRSCYVGFLRTGDRRQARHFYLAVWWWGEARAVLDVRPGNHL